uniref:AMP deaminase n=1 Tax=Tetraselmis chuii TaxID=63592 RepID=A0A7S1T255_9CHLO|mmetsp:Transcript_40962/g.73617  ORF Transcript_40962/g.73617 Transcript_40962/m.73617 type:complete len:951 (+) Transcript_40962:137-2989(+)
MASTSDSKLVIFLGGIALGGSIAIGSAYLLSRRFKDLEERFAAREAEDQERQPTSARDRTRRDRRRHSKYRSEAASPTPVTGAARSRAPSTTLHSNGLSGPANPVPADVFSRAGLDKGPSVDFKVGSPSAYAEMRELSLNPVMTNSTVMDSVGLPMSPSARRMQEEESDFDRFDVMHDSVQGNSDSEYRRSNVSDGGDLTANSERSSRKRMPSMPMIGPSDRGGSQVAISVMSSQLSPRTSYPQGHTRGGSEPPSAGHSTHHFPVKASNLSSSPPARTRSPAVGGGGSSGGGGGSNGAMVPAKSAAIKAPANGGGGDVPRSGSTSVLTQIVNQGKAIEDAAMQEHYSRVLTPETQPTEEQEEVCAMLKDCLDMRDKWLWRDTMQTYGAIGEYEPTAMTEHDFTMVNGVMHVWTDDSREELLCAPPGKAVDFFTDMHQMLKIISMGPVKTLCHHRLQLLEQKFNLHCMLNADKEFLAQKAAPHRDFYNVRKVDTHIHHSACMHQKHLLRFIKSKLKKEPDEVVIFRDGKYLTLKEVFESLNLTAYDLNVDTLDMHADKNIFHRFDKFNLKYNPCGQSRLREIFIKSDNIIHGRFLAELTQEVISDLDNSKYQHAEWRISVYGRKPVEWDLLAGWVCNNQLFSDNMLWLIQLPRLYNVYKDTGIIDNFQQMLDNLFVPLFEVTRDPASHPQLHIFLSHVVAFDCVDDESKPERRPNKRMRTPEEWDLKHNPAFSYYAYYIYANLHTLNQFREARGFNTFKFRPHCGEAGDIDHLASCFMLAENIAHGINLRKSPGMQYLYYLAQIGLCMSPLSNNSLFLDYHRNPFPVFFARGLNVSLSTDDPLQIHLTREPLVEEYSVAAQVWKLSAADLCEIARNSVLQSGFPHPVKMHWVGGQYWRPGPEGNDMQKTNVPNLRIRFRHDVYQEDLRFIYGAWRGYQDRMAIIRARADSN